MGTLRVLKKTADGEVTTLWKRSFMQGTNWMFANVEIYCKEKFQIYFEGIRGAGFKGDIGIDDVKIKDCSD